MRHSKSGTYRILFVVCSLVPFLFFVPRCYGDGTHRWAWGEQQVNNNGGDSVLNVWRPDPSPGVFSLAQHWYTGGSGNSLQTVEGWWQVSRSLYNTSDPV